MNTETGIARPRESAFGVWWRALRVHQWLKNLLVFLPIVLAHRWREWPLLIDVVWATAAFCLCASSVYILNDILDRDFDRRHPSKRNRPFASGALTVRQGLWTAAALLGASALIAGRLNGLFAACLALYFVLAAAYSLWIKRVPVLDVILLAALYTLRILAGSAAATIAPSFWLLAFSQFMFLSLALVKRYAEIDTTTRVSGDTLIGRGYGRDDATLMLGLGPAAGFVAVLVLALYINSPESLVLYRHPQALWLICPLLLYWVTRVWFLTARGQMHEDPVVFAARDPVSLAAGVLAVVAILVAT
jgi:4-hydroxybenzoate polyprenyltransferase